MLKIIDYTPELRQHIKTLNEAWLRKYFVVEPIDAQVLSDPETNILAPGGFIFYALWNEVVVGTASLMRIDDTTFELTKMAVDEAHQGKGIGNALMEHCILFAKQKGIGTLLLYSNTRLEPAIAMYRKFGFEEVPLGTSVYGRADIKMMRAVANAALYESEERVESAFKENMLPEVQQQAQWAELIELKKVINELYHRLGRAISILDIGVGSGRVIRRLQGIPEVWAQIAHYHGIDNAPACIELSGKVVKELKIQDKTSIHFFDVQNIAQWNLQHDLIMTTWFTGGNFFPPNFPFDTYKPLENRLDLRRNPVFEHIFQHAYKQLNPGGELVLGAVYRDEPATRIRQEQFYRDYDMEIITDETDTFTATKERFWSQRFTKTQIFDYFHFAAAANITITDLDTYWFAWQVRVKKD